MFVLALIVLQLSAISDNLFSGFYWFWLPASLVVCNDTFACVLRAYCVRVCVRACARACVACVHACVSA